MREYHKENDVIEYEGKEYQISSVQNVNPLSVGEDEIMYITNNRHGDPKIIMDWELLAYQLKGDK